MHLAWFITWVPFSEPVAIEMKPLYINNLITNGPVVLGCNK